MTITMNHPLAVFAVSFAAMWLAVTGGRRLRMRRTLEEGAHEDFDVILAATLTLLGLIIGFSFSMAVNRYDQRKNYEEEEANAIGTQMARAGLLPAADAARVRALLKTYLDQRIAFYQARDPSGLREINARTTQLQNELWVAVEGPAVAQPSPLTALAVSGMNDVLNTQGYTQAAWWNRIPLAAWGLMVLIGICCNVLLGYGSRNVKRGGAMPLILPLVVSIAFLLIADIDSPRGGLIHVVPQNLLSLQESLAPR